jgi:hypothetical protein
MMRDASERVADDDEDARERRLAQTRRPQRDGVQYGLHVARRARYEAQDFARRGLLLSRRPELRFELRNRRPARVRASRVAARSSAAFPLAGFPRGAIGLSLPLRTITAEH